MSTRAHWLLTPGIRAGSVFFGGYGADHDRLVECRLSAESVGSGAEGGLVRPDGGALGRRRTVSRGPRLYVQDTAALDWSVPDIS
ncbi:hypothetical protein [Streptomyces canus]|uniref:hypothetical protein n=1 Tax=Streptomyces canus TaxID=58343 RepID=UPI003246768A